MLMRWLLKSTQGLGLVAREPTMWLVGSFSPTPDLQGEWGWGLTQSPMVNDLINRADVMKPPKPPEGQGLKSFGVGEHALEKGFHSLFLSHLILNISRFPLKCTRPPTQNNSVLCQVVMVLFVSEKLPGKWWREEVGLLFHTIGYLEVAVQDVKAVQGSHQGPSLPLSTYPTFIITQLF